MEINLPFSFVSVFIDADRLTQQKPGWSGGANQTYLSVSSNLCYNAVVPLTKKIVQKLYKIHTNIIQSNVHIFCIQRLYKSKFYLIMNLQKMYIKFLHI